MRNNSIGVPMEKTRNRFQNSGYLPDYTNGDMESKSVISNIVQNHFKLKKHSALPGSILPTIKLNQSSHFFLESQPNEVLPDKRNVGNMFYENGSEQQISVQNLEGDHNDSEMFPKVTYKISNSKSKLKS